jgi:hypothetical protein
MRNLAKKKKFVKVPRTTDNSAYSIEHPLARQRELNTGYLKLLAEELQAGIPHKAANYDYIRFGTWPKNWYKRLKNAAKRGRAGVIEMLVCTMQSFMVYGPVTVKVDGKDTMEYKKYIPAHIRNYFQGLITLTANGLLYNRVPQEK